MDFKQEVESDSDDEVFCGKITLKEVKIRILGKAYYKNLLHATSNKKAFNDSDFKIIETNSEPNIRRDVTDSPVRQLKSSSDSQLKRSFMPKELVPDLVKEDIDLKQDIECDSDEVFSVNMTPKDIKNYFLRDIICKNLSNPTSNKNVFNDTDLKIIETNSVLNIRRDVTDSPLGQLKSTSESQLMKSLKPKELFVELENEDSFLQIEEHVTKQNKLDNTLDAVDFILNNAPSHIKNEQTVNVETEVDVDDRNDFICDVKASKEKILSQSSAKEDVLDKNTDKISIPKSRTVVHNAFSATKNIKHETPSVITPRFNKKATPTLFRTPNLPLSHRKDTNLVKTPRRTKAFDHIASPVATYIKKSPQVSLVKDVHPKKPLPSVSSIPKLKKQGSQIKIDNKENIVLPALAYKSAKKTIVMNMNKDDWPQSNLPKKLASSLTLKKPVVLQHDHRVTTNKPLVSQLDSFADLTLHQADVSICTEKIAFN